MRKIPLASTLIDGTNHPDFADLERRFFTSIRLSNGTFKTTCDHRLEDLNRLCLQLLTRLQQPLSVLDVGISSGISTLELSEGLTEAGHAHTIIGIDTCIDAKLVNYGFGFSVLEEPNGHVLHFYFGDRVVRNWSGKMDILRLQPLARLACLMAQMTLPAIGQRKAREFKLVSPRLVERPGISVQEKNLFDIEGQFFSRFNLVRAANVLNRGYFSKAELTRAVRILKQTLVPGGLLAICRTLESGINHGTVLTLRSDGVLSPVARLGNGSEIEDLAISLT